MGLFWIVPFTAYAEEPLPDEMQTILEQPGITSEEFQSMGLTQLIERIKGLLKSQNEKPFRLLIRMIGTILLSAAVLSLVPQSEWQDELETICILGVFLFSLEPAFQLASKIGECILEWRNYLASFVPVFSGVLISCGQPGQAAVYSGMFLTMAIFSAQLIATVIMPVLQVYIALNTASGICKVGGLSDGCAFLTKTIKWVLGLLSILFSAVLGLQSALALTTDNLAMKTGRFLINNGVPLVGRMASEAMGSVLCSLKVLKGSLGFAAIAFLSIAFIPILLQSIGYQMTYYLGSISAKAFGLTRIGKLLEGLGQAIGICISFLVFFFILIVLSTALMILLGGS